MLKNCLKLIDKYPEACPIIAGSILGIGFCSYVASLALLISFLILIKTLQKAKSAKEVFRWGWGFGIMYFYYSLSWVEKSFECVGVGYLGYPAVVILSIYLALYPAFACYLTNLFVNSGRIKFVFLFPIFWTIMEYLRGIVFTGFPWNLIGYATYDIPYFPQIADVFGIYGVSFIVVFIISLLSYKKTLYYGMILFVVSILYGYYKIELYGGYIYSKNMPEVTIVQPSIKQEDKMNPEKLKENIDAQIVLSKPSDIIIWPEAALSIQANSDVFKYIAFHVLRRDNSYLITGCDRFDRKKRRLYNSAHVLDKNGTIIQTYDKIHLLPFGEFIPEFLLKLGVNKLTDGVINFSRGNSPKTIKLKDFEPFEIGICYEAVFPGETVDNPDSKWILNITNDAWFKETAGPRQHLRIAAFRAIEEGKPMIRCANNGISAVIDCHGKIRKFLQTNDFNSITIKVPNKSQQTIFSRLNFVLKNL